MITRTIRSPFLGVNPKQNPSALPQQASMPPRLASSAADQPDHFAPSMQLRFAGGPSQDEMHGIMESLTGWQNTPSVIGPNYFAPNSVAQALQANFFSATPVPEAILRQIAEHKAQIQNVHTLLLGKPAVHPDALRPEVHAFTQELAARMQKLNRVFSDMNVSPQAAGIFDVYAIATAPTLYAMGFPDAVAHAADVAQLAFLQAKKQGATEPEALQALMVGWLHDPKLPGALSWSNLATHPAIASSMAHYLLNQPAMQAQLKQYLSRQHARQGSVNFANGVVEALSINNDSKWILDNVILHQAADTPTPSEPGLADAQEGLNASDCAEIEKHLTQRFEAPSQGKAPQAIPRHLLEKMNQVAFSTDLRGLNRNALPEDVKKLLTPEIIRQLLEGKPEDRPLWAITQKLLWANPSPGLVINPKVRGGTITSHHTEATLAPKAALALATADPLLLSPHKILARPREHTAPERLDSFLKSFDDNLRYLPLNAHAQGQAWRKHVHRAILKATTEETLDDAIAPDSLLNRLSAPEIWRGDLSTVSLASGVLPENFQALLARLKDCYEEAVNTHLMQLPPVADQTKQAKWRRILTSLLPSC